MVDHEPETLRSTQSQWENDAGWDQSSPDRSRLWSATTTVQNALEAPTVHTDSVEKASGGVEVLRGACALTPPTVCRLD